MSDKLVKHLNFGQDAKDQIFKGIEKLTKAVSSTLGASGKCVILEDDQGKPVITKDGVTVAKFIDLENSFQNAGAQIVKQAAEKTNQEAGDVTTTTTVLTYAMYREAQKYLASGAPPVELKKGMDRAHARDGQRARAD